MLWDSAVRSVPAARDTIALPASGRADPSACQPGSSGSGGSGAALDGGTAVRAAFITIDSSV